MERVIDSIVWMVNWMSSALAGDNDIEAQVDDPAGNSNDDAEPAEVWGVAGVQSRPKDGNAVDGYAKALRIQLGDAIVVIGTHDPRHVEPAQAGEVVVHALGKDGTARALIRLKPDGTVQVEGDTMEAVGTSPLAIGGDVKAHLAPISADLITLWAAAGAPGSPTYNYGTLLGTNPIDTTKLKGS